MSVRWTLEEVMDLLRETPEEPLPRSVDAQLAHDAELLMTDLEEVRKALTESKAFEGMSPTIH